MNARRLATTFLALAVLATLSGCDRSASNIKVTTQTRQVESFDSLAVQGAVRLQITVGAPHSLVLEGPAACLDRTVTELKGTTLHVHGKRQDWFFMQPRPRITLRIALPHLASLRLEGGNDVRIGGLAGGQTSIAAAGAAHIKAQGQVQELIVSMAGAGHADLSQLIADHARVTLEGVGSVIVHPQESLDATMNGVGAILYTGNPRRVNTRMNGLGTIGRRDEQAKVGEDGSTIAPPAAPPERNSPALAPGGSTEVI